LYVAASPWRSCNSASPRRYRGINLKKLIFEYRKKRPVIRKRLGRFRNVHKGKDADIFSEMAFCILTPQSKAVYCDKAVEDLRKSGLLFNGCRRRIGRRLKGRVRFHNNKAAYIIAARRRLTNDEGKIDIKSRLDEGEVPKTRDWLAKNIKGLGYKEASHFLRNIGLGRDIAIIDRHILENLKRYGILKKAPRALGRKNYMEIENKIREFSRRVRIPMEELDLLFWSRQTGFLFK